MILLLGFWLPNLAKKKKEREREGRDGGTDGERKTKVLMILCLLTRAFQFPVEIKYFSGKKFQGRSPMYTSRIFRHERKGLWADFSLLLGLEIFSEQGNREDCWEG